MRTVILVAKGPSAIDADALILKNPTADVACINEAFLLVHRRQVVDFCFFTHYEYATLITEKLHRVKCAICPNLLKHEGVSPPEKLQKILLEYEDRYCDGDEAALLERINTGGLTHHNTVNGALHWLCKYGKYAKIILVGVDGGRDYAATMSMVSDKVHNHIVNNEGTEDYFDIWKNVTRTLVNLLTRIYAVEITWHESKP